MICVIRQTPRREPKFHQYEMFDGVGRSINELLIIFNMGWVFRVVGAIVFVVEYNVGFSDQRSWLESR